MLNCKRLTGEAVLPAHVRKLLLTSRIVVAGCVLVGCNAPATRTTATAQDEATPTPESGGYAEPPSLAGAAVDGTDLRVRGRATPGAQVRMAAPDGWSTSTVAGRDGGWTARVPAAAEPKMYALSMSTGGRVVRAEGALLTTPAPGHTAILARSGYAAQPLPERASAPVIVAIDFDAVGSAATGGVAAPNTRVQLTVDGQPADVDLTDSGGRFALVGPRTRPLASGRHAFIVSSPQGSAEATVALTPPAPLGSRAMRATRDASGWRVDWAAPGGGVQSTLVLDRAGRGAS